MRHKKKPIEATESAQYRGESVSTFPPCPPIPDPSPRATEQLEETMSAPVELRDEGWGTPGSSSPDLTWAGRLLVAQNHAVLLSPQHTHTHTSGIPALKLEGSSLENFCARFGHISCGTVTGSRSKGLSFNFTV